MNLKKKILYIFLVVLMFLVSINSYSYASQAKWDYL